MIDGKVLEALAEARYLRRNVKNLVGWKDLEGVGKEMWRQGAYEDLEFLSEAGLEIVQKDRWQDIETAPKDGTEVLLYMADGSVADGVWESKREDAPDDYGCDAGWHNDCGTMFPGRSFANPEYRYEPVNPPTYWQPLPSKPQQE